MEPPIKKNDIVTFRMDPTKSTVRHRGAVVSCVYCGKTEVGNIPDFTVEIVGDSGARVTVSLVENYVRKK